MRVDWAWLLCLSLLLVSTEVGVRAGGAGAYHRTPLNEPSDTNGVASLHPTNTPLKQISGDIYALGLIRLDRSKRTVSFPAAVNMTEGAIEYALVHVSGKVHESVLKTEANPLHIQLAWLLIAPKGQGGSPPDRKLPRELLGPPVDLWVQWRVGNAEKRVALEELVTNTLTKSPMKRGPWIYSGSRVVEGTFLAERDGSIAAIIADPDALINNPRPGRDSDDIWTPNRSILPPAGTAVEVVIQAASNADRH